MTDWYKLAYEAHRNTSFSPDKRAEDFCTGFSADIKELEYLGIDADRIKRYEKLVVRWLNVKSRCISFMITGPANFPVARAEKANKAEHNAASAMIEYRKKIVEFKEKESFYKENPEAKPIMAGDNNALDRLRGKLSRATKEQEDMKAVNKAYREYIKEPKSLDDSNLSEEQKAIIRKYVPAYSWEPNPYAPFELANNLANIKRIESRIKEIESRKATEPKELKINGIRVVENTETMRLQIFFDKKPESSIIQLLKTNGFKWAPSVMAWQRQLTNNAISAFNYRVLPVLKG